MQFGNLPDQCEQRICYSEQDPMQIKSSLSRIVTGSFE